MTKNSGDLELPKAPISGIAPPLLPSQSAIRFRGSLQTLVPPEQSEHSTMPPPDPNADHGHVELWRRPTHIEGGYSFVNDLGVDHYWIKTDKYEAGMGGKASAIPGQGAADEPLTPTETVDHTGQSKTKDAEKVAIPYIVDEACVDKLIKPGQDTGRFVPGVNDCKEFAADVLSQCRVDKPRRFSFE